MKHFASILLVTSLLLSVGAPFIAQAQLDAAQAAANAAGDQTAQAVAQAANGQTPASQAAAYSFKSQGLFGCNLNGAYAMSVGAMSAIGGVYVPVNDAAVTLNTGVLVYKECVLRVVIDTERAAATAGYDKNVITAFNNGNNGKGLFPKNFIQSIGDRQQATIIYQANQLKNSGALDNTSKNQQIQAVAQSYLKQIQDPWVDIRCPYKNQNSTFSAILAAGDARCRPYEQALLARDTINNAVAQDQFDYLFKLQTSNGVLGVEQTDANNQHITLTPGYIVAANALQSVQSGYKQLQNANDIGQMVGALYAGLSAQVVSGATGLSGVMQTTGGQPSYLDQLTAEQSANVRSSAVNAALQVLAAAQQVEATYLQAVNSIANTLTQTINQLRGIENQCWGLVIQHVCASPMAADNTCTDAAGNRLKVATSTAFSQAIISTQIAPLAQTALSGAKTSQDALNLINTMIQGVTNTNSLDAQRIALQQLDTLVAQHKLHTQNDLPGIQQQQQAVQGNMSTLIDNTKQAWADSTDANVGWCNINNQPVIDMWDQRWKQ